MSNGGKKHAENASYSMDESLADAIARKGKVIVTPFSCLTCRVESFFFCVQLDKQCPWLNRCSSHFRPEEYHSM